MLLWDIIFKKYFELRQPGHRYPTIGSYSLQEVGAEFLAKNNWEQKKNS